MAKPPQHATEVLKQAAQKKKLLRVNSWMTEEFPDRRPFRRGWFYGWNKPRQLGCTHNKIVGDAWPELVEDWYCWGNYAQNQPLQLPGQCQRESGFCRVGEPTGVKYAIDDTAVVWRQDTIKRKEIRCF